MGSEGKWWTACSVCWGYKWVPDWSCSPATAFMPAMKPCPHCAGLWDLNTNRRR